MSKLGCVFCRRRRLHLTSGSVQNAWDLKMNCAGKKIFQHWVDCFLPRCWGTRIKSVSLFPSLSDLFPNVYVRKESLHDSFVHLLLSLSWKDSIIIHKSQAIAKEGNTIYNWLLDFRGCWWSCSSFVCHKLLPDIRWLSFSKTSSMDIYLVLTSNLSMFFFIVHNTHPITHT